MKYYNVNLAKFFCDRISSERKSFWTQWFRATYKESAVVTYNLTAISNIFRLLRICCYCFFTFNFSFRSRAVVFVVSVFNYLLASENITWKHDYEISVIWFTFLFQKPRHFISSFLHFLRTLFTWICFMYGKKIWEIEKWKKN